MKKFNKSLRMSFIIILATFAVAFVSCSKADLQSSNNGGSGGITPLSGSASVVPNWGFNAFMLKVEWSSNKPVNYAGFTNATSGYFYTAPLVGLQKRDTVVSTSAVLTSGSETFNAPYSYTIFSNDKKVICWNDVTSAFGKWFNTISKVSHDGGITWSNGPIDPALWVTYLPSGSRQLNLPNGIFNSGWQIRYEGETIFINLAETFQPKNEYKILTLTGSQMVIEQEKSGTIFRLTYQNS